jgi:hypothetical protein
MGSAQAVSRGGGGVDDAIGGSNPLLNGLTGGLAGLSIGANGTKSGSVGGGGSSNPSSSSVAATATTGADGAAGSAINSDFGLLGLLSIIRMTDSDRNALALGDDLAALGLDMKSKDKLTDTFGGPFTDKPASSEPNYHVSDDDAVFVGLLFIYRGTASLTSSFTSFLSLYRYPCVIT